jgi:hypothetical protein
LGASELIIDEEHPHLQIPRPSKPPNAAQMALARIMAFLSGFLPKPESRDQTQRVGFRIQGADSSGTHISIPLLELRPGRLIVSDRTAYIPWIGGVPPYRLQIYPKNADQAIVTIPGIAAPPAAFEQTRLAAGDYRVVIADAREISSGGPLSIVRAPEMPSLPDAERDALRSGNAPDELKATVLASWLAAQQDGAWSLEAYQYVAQLPDDFLPAVLLRRELMGIQ